MSKQNKIILIVVVIIILVLGVSFVLKNNRSPISQQQNGDKNNYQIKPVRPIDQTDHLWGKIDAPVQLIIYSDFECPYCADFTKTIEQVKQQFSDQVVIAFRHYPLTIHAEAVLAAEASECAAEQGQFWQMYDQLFNNNKTGQLNKEQFKKDAADLGLDQVKFNQCLESEKYKDKVLAQMIEGKNAGVTGTPTSFVNGQILVGAYPFEDFTARDGKKELGMKSIIEGKLKK